MVLPNITMALDYFHSAGSTSFSGQAEPLATAGSYILHNSLHTPVYRSYSLTTKPVGDPATLEVNVHF